MKYELQPSADPTICAQEWLDDFEMGRGVEILEIDIARLTGEYLILPSGFMIVDESEGRKPWFYFKTLQITQADKTSSFSGEEEIVLHFNSTHREYPTGDDHLHEFCVTDSLFGNSE